MNSPHKLFKGKGREIIYLISRNVFILINVIIFSVVALLIYFGDTKEAIFLSIIIVLNTGISIFQEIHAWLVLEKLNLLTAMLVTRINSDGTQSRVPPNEIKNDDVIKLKLGDQVPCDGVLIESQGMEVNTALITGESKSLVKSAGDEVLAGSIVTAGSDQMRATATYAESRIAQMTAKIKKYSKSRSPLQDAVNMVIKYAGFILLGVILLIVVRGVEVKEPAVAVVQSIGALASVLVPQGLAIALTLLFAYGAGHLLKRHVLLQEVNAVEKFGHIKNLCMDKTGTLTENIPTIDDVHLPLGTSREEMNGLIAAYVNLSEDSSETILAIKKYIQEVPQGMRVLKTLPFSSSRRYGGIVLKKENEDEGMLIFLGAPEVFMEHLASGMERTWLQDLVQEHAPLSKRIVCLVRTKGSMIPDDLSHSELSVVAVFTLQDALREGVREAINFFQNRGVRIRIISGDNLETVRGVVLSAGINQSESSITGDEIENLNEVNFIKKVRECTIFARIKPEQKEKIIDALKKDGFTAMIGDGANDALAVKTADLGIAMFDGAPATRKLASVVLTRNSFAELPGGVRFADNMLENVEIYSSMFFNQTFLGFFLLVMVSVLGYSYPYTPLNITFINYFTVGIPSILIFYWTIHPRRQANPFRGGTFLKRVLAFPLASAAIQSLGTLAVFILSLAYFGEAKPNTSVALGFIGSGFIFFLLAQRVYGATISRGRKIEFAGIVALECLVIYWALRISIVTTFFNVALPSTSNILMIVVVSLICGFGQYEISNHYAKKYRQLQLPTI